VPHAHSLARPPLRRRGAVAIAVVLAAAASLGIVAGARADYAIQQCGHNPAPPWQGAFGGLVGADGCVQTGWYLFDDGSGTTLPSAANYGSSVVIPPSMTGLAITHLTMFWRAAGDTGPNLAFFTAADSHGTPLVQSQLRSTPNDGLVNVAMNGGSGYDVWIYCSTSTSTAGCDMTSANILGIGATTVTLRDSAPPRVSATGGALLAGGPQQGAQPLQFDAADDGSGVREVSVSLGNQVVADNDYHPRCAYVRFDPCPNQLDDTAEVDTTQVPDGVYPVLITATDADGNRTTSAGGTVQVDNSTTAGSLGTLGPGLGNGSPAVSPAVLRVTWARSGGAQLARSSYGARQLARGRLTTPAGQPIAGATILVSGASAVSGAAAVPEGQAQTAHDGTFSFLTAGHESDRTLQFVYERRLGDATPAASAQLVLGVDAPLTLDVRPRVGTLSSETLLAPRKMPQAMHRSGYHETQASGLGGRLLEARPYLACAHAHLGGSWKMPLLVDSPPTASSPVQVFAFTTSVQAVTVSHGAHVVMHATFDEDPFVESPMHFVPGLEAHPTRGPQEEPTGSGPFGF
jgi:hypothetical protein